MIRKIILGLIVFLLIQADIHSEEFMSVNDMRQEINDQEKEMDMLEKEISNYKKSLLSLGVKEKKIEKELEKSEEEADKVKKSVKYIEDSILKVKDKLEYTANQLSKKVGRFTDYNILLEDSLKYYFMRKHRADQLDGIYNRIVPCRGTEESELLLIQYPYEKCNLIQKGIDADTELKNRLEKEKDNLQSLEKKLSKEQDKLIDKQKEQLELLKNIRASRSDTSKEIERLRSEKLKLSNLLSSLKLKAKNLERLRELAKDFAAAKGDLPWPLPGKIVSYFGKQKHPQLDTYVINRGVKILPYADTDIKVRSVGAGEVVFSDEFEGLGIMVVIDHGNNYYTVYGNLVNASVKLGSEVDIQGELGILGSLPLYFELGKGNTAEDPLLWIKKQ